MYTVLRHGNELASLGLSRDLISSLFRQKRLNPTYRTVPGFMILQIHYLSPTLCTYVHTK